MIRSKTVNVVGQSTVLPSSVQLNIPDVAKTFNFKYAASGAAIGATFGGIGALVGSVIGGFADLLSALHMGGTRVLGWNIANQIVTNIPDAVALDIQRNLTTAEFHQMAVDLPNRYRQLMQTWEGDDVRRTEYVNRLNADLQRPEVAGNDERIIAYVIYDFLMSRMEYFAVADKDKIEPEIKNRLQVLVYDYMKEKNFIKPASIVQSIFNASPSTLMIGAVATVIVVGVGKNLFGKGLPPMKRRLA